MGATVSLNDKEILWLESIIVDKDRDEALKLAELLKKKIDEQEGHKCGPRF